MDLQSDAFVKKLLSERLLCAGAGMDEILRQLPKSLHKKMEDFCKYYSKKGAICTANCTDLRHEDIAWEFKIVTFHPHPAYSNSPLSALPQISYWFVWQSTPQIELWGLYDRNVFGEKWQKLAKSCQEKPFYLLLNAFMEAASNALSELERGASCCIREECGDEALILFEQVRRMQQEKNELCASMLKFRNFAADAVRFLGSDTCPCLQQISKSLLGTKSFTKSSAIAKIREQVDVLVEECTKLMANNPFFK